MSLFHKKDKEHKDSKEQIASLQKQLETLQKESADQIILFQDTIVQKDKELIALKKDYKTIKDKSDEDTKKMEEMKTELAELNTQKTKYFDESRELKKKVGFLETARTNLEDERNGFERDLQEYKNKVNNLIKDKNEATDQLEILRKQMIKKDETMAQNQSEDLLELRKEKEKIENECKELLIRYTSTKQELDTLRQQYKEEKEKNDQRIIEIQRSLEEKNTQLQRNLEEKQSLIQRSKEEKETLIQRNLEEKKSLMAKTIEEKNKNEELKKGEGDPEYNQSLAEILSDYLVKTNSNKFSLSLFDLFQVIIINLQLFDEIFENCEDIEAVNEIPLLLYAEINRYLTQNSSNIENIKLNDFLLNSKFIMQSNYDKNIIDLIKKVKFFNDKNGEIFETYKKKKDRFNKLAESNFDMIKNYIQVKLKNKEKKTFTLNMETVNRIASLTEEKKALEIDFRKLPSDKKTREINSLISYSIKEKITTAEKVKVFFNAKNSIDDLLFFIYFLKFYNSKIKSLSLNFENTKADRPMIKYFQEKFPFILGILTELKELELRNIDMLPEGMETLNLIKALTNSKIEKLCLVNALTKYSSFYISEYLAKSKILVEIQCSEHSTEGIVSSFVLYLKNQPNLVSLNLSNNVLSQGDFEGISEFMQSENNLKTINLANVKMTSENCNTFGLGLRKSKKIETLILSNCQITSEGFNFIINRNTSPGINKIVMDNNKFGDMGLTGMCTYFRGNPNFKFLSIKNCGITLQSFSILKMFIGMSPLTGVEIHLEENEAIENGGLADQFGQDKILEEKGIKIFIRMAKLDKKVIEKLSKFKEIVLV
ncbi:MAG: hypothetical protein MJ252_21080 [archaeon]|nr:hypothetical protein [archaeon]